MLVIYGRHYNSLIAEIYSLNTVETQLVKEKIFITTENMNYYIDWYMGIKSTHRKVIADDLDGGAASEVRPRRPVVLVEGVLDGDHREVLAEVQVHLGELVGRQVVGRVGGWVLEVKVVSSVLEEFRCSNIHTNFNLREEKYHFI